MAQSWWDKYGKPALSVINPIARTAAVVGGVKKAVSNPGQLQNAYTAINPIGGVGLALGKKLLPSSLGGGAPQGAAPQGAAPQGQSVTEMAQGAPQFQGNVGGIYSQYGLNQGPNTQGLEAIRAQSLAAPGQSAWGQYARAQQEDQTQQQLGQGNVYNQSQLNTGLSNLAGSGGLSGGARERLSQRAMEQGSVTRQQVLGQGRQAQMGIDTQAEQMRQSSLMGLPGMENQYMATKLGLTQPLQQENMAQQQFNLDRYKTLMQAQSAQTQAAAETASANKKGFLEKAGDFLNPFD